MPVIALAVIVLVLAVAALALALTHLLRTPVDPSVTAPAVGRPVALAAGVAVLGLLLTIPSSPPFQPGMRLGLGFACGTLMAILAALAVVAFQRRAMVGATAAPALHLLTALLALPVIGLTVLNLALFNSVLDAVLGTALGTLVAGLILRTALARRPDESGSGLRAFDWYLTAVVLLSASEYLAVQHFPQTGLLAQMSPLLIGTGMLVGLVIAALLAGMNTVAEDRAYSLIVTTGVALVVTTLLGQVAGIAQRSFPYVVAMTGGRQHDFSQHGLILGLGAVVAALVLWVGYLTLRRSATGGAATATGAAAALLLVLLLAVGFQRLVGWGLALALLPLLAATAAAIAADLRHPQHPLSATVGAVALAAVQVGAAVLLWRVFIERLGPDSALDAGQPYLLIALLLGLAVPLLLAELPARGMVSAFKLIIPTLLLPAVLFVLWGPRALAGVYWGVIAGGFVIVLGLLRRQAPGHAPLVPLAGLLVALSGAQFLPLLEPLTDSPRVYKLVLALGVTILCGLWALWETLAAPADEEDDEDAI